MNAVKKIRHQFLHWLLVDPTDGVIRFAGVDERGPIEAVAALHLRAASGEKVPTELWAAARDAARDAAWAAARDAAVKRQQEKLFQLLQAAEDEADE